MSSADLKCPVCNKALEGSEYGHAARQLEKSVLQKYREQLKNDKQAHRKQVQVMAKKYQKEKKSLQKRFGEQAKRSKESQKDRGMRKLRPRAGLTTNTGPGDWIRGM